LARARREARGPGGIPPPAAAASGERGYQTKRRPASAVPRAKPPLEAVEELK
jgi:hypothetical protein